MTLNHKTCTKCNASKTVSEFSKNNSSRDKLQSWCRSCMNTNSSMRRQTFLIANEAYIDTYKVTLGCEGCGYNTDPKALDLDHIDPYQKKHNVSTMKYSKSLDDIKVEIAKCRVLCANCHRRKTYANKDWLTRRA